MSIDDDTIKLVSDMVKVDSENESALEMRIHSKKIKTNGEKVVKLIYERRKPTNPSILRHLSAI